MLVVASVINLCLALLHVAIVLIGPSGYRFFRAPENFAIRAAEGDPIPALLTLCITGVFVVFSIYTASGAGLVRKLPFTELVLCAITSVFLMRGMLIIPQLIEIPAFAGEAQSVAHRDVIFSGCAFVIGLIHAIGSWNLLKQEKEYDIH